MTTPTPATNPAAETNPAFVGGLPRHAVEDPQRAGSAGGAGALGWVGGALADLEAAGLRRFPAHRATAAGRLANGLVNLASNDYLGLAGDPRLAEAAARAARDWGSGAGASRLVTGGTGLHRALEEALADWKGTEDALVFSSGYLANTGTISALASRGDAVLSDALNHASIVDGCRLSRAEVVVHPHGDLEALARALERTAGARRRLIVVDGVFSMDGDVADLPGLAALAKRHDAMLMVDDAHGCGVLGPDGRGTAALQGCASAVDVHLGTLSKAFGSAGGYVAGSRDLCDWLRNRARGFVFDTALPPPAVGAALEALRIVRAEPERRAHALALARRLAAGLGVAEPAACVVPLVVGEPDPAMTAAARLRDAGYLVPAIRPPSVPAGTSRLRFTTTAAHTEADVDGVLEALAG